MSRCPSFKFRAEFADDVGALLYKLSTSTRHSMRHSLALEQNGESLIGRRLLLHGVRVPGLQSEHGALPGQFLEGLLGHLEWLEHLNPTTTVFQSD